MKLIDSEKTLYIQETETKPNKYSCIVLTCTLAWIIMCWVLNEIGVFRVGNAEMRIGCSLTLLIIAVPLVAVFVNRKLLSSPKTKYVILISASLFSLSVTVLMTFHTTLLLLFPILIAMLYRSKTLGKVAVISSVFCTVVSINMAYMLGTWDIPLLQELINIGTNGVTTVEGVHDGITIVSVCKIMLYIVLPRLLMVGSCCVLMFYIISISTDNVNNHIIINRMSYRDALTDLYNRNYYKQIVEAEGLSGPVGVIFFDVNNLKQTNDEHGHDYGDTLLRRCALSIGNICDEEKSVGIRMGGDEFLLLLEDAGEEEILAKFNEWRRSIEEVNEENRRHYDGLVCSLATGYAVGDYSNLQSVVRTADERMYENKRLSQN